MQQSPRRGPDWPAPERAMEAARSLVRELGARGARVVVAPDRDVDGLASGALAARALGRLGARTTFELPLRGEHAHSASMRERLERLGGDALVVLDMGSRAGAIVPGLPTLVIDHHDARQVPAVSVYVSSAGHEPVAPTGLLTYMLLRALAPLDDAAWLAVLATLADLGRIDAFPELAPVADRHRATHLKECVVLLNAARRAGRYRPEVALDVVLRAPGPEAIARGEIAGVAELARCRAEVNAEVARVARIAPRIAGDVALVRFASAAQIHPLLATRWSRRLAPRIVVAANDGYLPGRVSFAVRSASNVDLLAFLRGLPLGVVEGEFASGHPRATGGSVPPREFERILHVLGFPGPCATHSSPTSLQQRKPVS